MESQIYDAVLNDNLPQLKKIIYSLSPSEVKRVASMKFDGTTLLLIAARYGHYRIMKFLIEYCEVDVEQVGEVEFDDDLEQDAPPLWCAAAAGNLNCVKLLVENGADVNCTTLTNSTPLRAACFDGHFEVVQFLVENGADIEICNKQGHTCLMISCYRGHSKIAHYLIERGCQINRQSVHGNTALHDCVESPAYSKQILQLLVRHGASPKNNCFGLSPLMTAAFNGRLETFLFLKSAYDCSLEEEADAYKLIGAFFLDRSCNLSEALKHWKRAVEITNKCCKKYRDQLNKSDESFLKAYGNMTEFQTEQDLDNIVYDVKLSKIQAMIIRERLLGIHHHETYYHIRLNGMSYLKSEEYERCLSLWMYNLQQQQLHSKLPSEITQNSFEILNDLFSLMYSKNEPCLRTKDIFNVLKMAISQLLACCCVSPKVLGQKRLYCLLDEKLIKDVRCFKTNHFFDGLDRQFPIIIKLISFICHYQIKMSASEWEQFEKIIIEFLSCDPRSTNSYSMLHIICLLSSKSRILDNTPIFDILKFIVGLMPEHLNLVDIRGNTPLHFLLECNPVDPDMVEYLLKSGSHIDLPNISTVTPMDVLKEHPKLKNYSIKYCSLQCLCAQVIIRNGIGISHRLPNDLKQFIMQHQPKEFLTKAKN